MAGTIGHIPDFTPNDGEPPATTTPPAAATPPAEPAADEVIEPETIPPETPPGDVPGDETLPPAGDVPPEKGDDLPPAGGAANDDPNAVQGLKSEAELLRNDIVELRRTRRQLREGGEPVEPPAAAGTRQQPDEPVDTSDILPEDQDRMDRFLKSRGYVKKDQLESTQAVDMQNTEIDAFMERHPEYKPENVSGDVRWGALKREIALYARPKDRTTFKKILERSHAALPSVSTPPTRTPEQQRTNVRRAAAGSGGGGHVTTTPRPSGGGIPAHLRSSMKGFTQKEMDEM